MTWTGVFLSPDPPFCFLAATDFLCQMLLPNCFCYVVNLLWTEFSETVRQVNLSSFDSWISLYILRAKYVPSRQDIDWICRSYVKWNWKDEWNYPVEAWNYMWSHVTFTTIEGGVIKICSDFSLYPLRREDKGWVGKMHRNHLRTAIFT